MEQERRPVSRMRTRMCIHRCDIDTPTTRTSTTGTAT